MSCNTGGSRMFLGSCSFAAARSHIFQACRTRRAISSSQRIKDDQTRIHVIGFGHLSRLIVHSLRTLDDPPPTTVLVDSNAVVENLAKAGGKVELNVDNVSTFADGFEIQAALIAQSKQRRDSSSKYLTLRKSHLIPDQVILGESQHPTVGEEAANSESDNGKPKMTRLAQFTNDHIPKTAMDISKSKSLTTFRVDQSRIKFETYDEARKTSSVINHAIVSMASRLVVQQLDLVKHRFGKNSTILFLIRGLGFLEELDAKVFTNPKTRPTYVRGDSTHRLYGDREMPTEPTEPSQMPVRQMEDPLQELTAKAIAAKRLDHSDTTIMFRSYVKQWGELLIGPPYVRDKDKELHGGQKDRMKYLLNTLHRCSQLGVRIEDSDSSMMMRLLRVSAAHAVVHPLSVIFGCYNGDILLGDERKSLFEAVLREISSLLVRIDDRLTYHKLQDTVFRHIENTSDYVSSMLYDIAAGRDCSIDYLNGFLVNFAKKNYPELDMTVNEGLVREVKREADYRYHFIYDERLLRQQQEILERLAVEGKQDGGPGSEEAERRAEKKAIEYAQRNEKRETRKAERDAARKAFPASWTAPKMQVVGNSALSLSRDGMSTGMKADRESLHFREAESKGRRNKNGKRQQGSRSDTFGVDLQMLEPDLKPRSGPPRRD